MKNLALALTVLLLAAVAYLLIGGEADDGVVSLEERAEEVVGRSPAELGGAPAEVAVSEGGERVHVDVAGAAGAEEARDVTALTGPTRELLVVDGATGAPVAGAAVHQIDLDGGRFDSPKHFVGAVVDMGLAVLDGPLDAATFGRTDADGRVSVRDELFGTAVLVQFEGKRGFGLLSLARDTGDVVRLVEPRAAVVEVVDGAGRPLSGVGLATRSSVLSGYVRAGATDAQGRWTWHEANSLLLPALLGADEQVPERAGIEAHSTLVPENAVTVDLVNPGRAVLELDGGTVEVQLVSADGEGWWSAGFSVLLVVGKGMASTSVNAEGRAVFEGVPLGSHVSANAWARGATGRNVHLVAEAGPLTTDGLTLELGPLPKMEPELFVRLVDAAGTPLADAHVRGTVVIKPPPPAEPQGLHSMQPVASSSPIDKRTDADGRLALQVLIGTEALADGVRLAFTARVEWDGTIYAMEELVQTGPSQPPWDFGDVVCEPAELLVAGTVVTSDGDPIPDADLRATLSAADRTLAIAGRDDELWLDDEGGFAIHHDSTGQAGGWSLKVSHPRYGRAELEFAAGEHDLEVVLHAAGALVVSIAPDQRGWLPGLALRGRRPGLSVAAQPQILGAGRPDGEGWATGFFRPDGTLVWSGLEPGPIELELVYEEEPLEALGSFAIESGRTLRDPSLQELRLDAWLTAVPVTVTNTAGEPIEGVTVAEPRGVLAWPPGGRPLAADGVIVRELPAERIFLADGYRSQKVRLNGAPLTVVMEAEATVWLRLPAEAQASEHVRVALVNPAMGTGEVRESSWRAVDAPAVEVPVEAWGTQRVYLEWKVDHGDFFSRAMGPVPGQTFELQRGDAGRAFDVALPEEILDDLR